MKLTLDKKKEIAINKVKEMSVEEFKNVQSFISGMEAMKCINKKQSA